MNSFIQTLFDMYDHSCLIILLGSYIKYLIMDAIQKGIKVNEKYNDAEKYVKKI